MLWPVFDAKSDSLDVDIIFNGPYTIKTQFMKRTHTVKKHRQSCTGTDEQLVTNEQLFKNIFHWFYILKEQRD